jgi:hypothetical protein
MTPQFRNNAMLAEEPSSAAEPDFLANFVRYPN